METDICQFEKCYREPEYECKCLNKISYFCKSHLREHSKINTSHSISQNFKEISEGLKEIMITQCEISLRSLKEMRNKINKKSNEIIKAVIKQTIIDLDFVRKIELSIMKSIDFLNSSNKIVNKKHQTAEEEFVIKHFQNTEKLKEEIETQEAQILEELDVEKKVLEMKLDIAKIKNQVDEMKYKIELNTDTGLRVSKKIGEIDEEIVKEKEELESISDKVKQNTEIILDIGSTLGLSDNLNSLDYNPEMVYFEDNSKTFVSIDVRKNTDRSFVCNISDELTYRGGFCRISKSKCFFYGGSMNGDKNYAYIIDANLKTGEKKASWKDSCYTGLLTLIKDSIFVFGIRRNTDCSKYNITLNSWEDIASLPSLTHCNSSAQIGDYILITGYNIACAYIYKIPNNIYTSTCLLSPNKYKILCRFNSKIYIFDNNKLYEGSEKTLNEFIVTNQSTGVPNNGWLISFPTSYKGYLYFVLDGKNIYRMNFLTGSISLFRAVNIVN